MSRSFLAPGARRIKVYAYLLGAVENARRVTTDEIGMNGKKIVACRSREAGPFFPAVQPILRLGIDDRGTDGLRVSLHYSLGRNHWHQWLQVGEDILSSA